jgi:hypothetical protein
MHSVQKGYLLYMLSVFREYIFCVSLFQCKLLCLQKFILRPNYESPVVKSAGNNVIEIKDGTFLWESSQFDEPRKRGMFLFICDFVCF